MWQLLVENRTQVLQIHNVDMVYVSVSLQNENKSEHFNILVMYLSTWCADVDIVVLVTEDTALSVQCGFYTPLYLI